MFSRSTVRKSQDPCYEGLVVCKEFIDAELQTQRGRVGPKPERSDEPEPPGAGNASVDLEDTP